MRAWWYRLLENSDVAQAKRAAWIAGGLVIVLLYTLGGLSLYVRRTMLSPTASPAATATATPLSIVMPTSAETPTEMPATEAPTLTATPTLYPTMTPDASQ